jgi:hypothetical protein
MKLTTFPEQNATIAKAQPPYIPMPVHVAYDEQGRMVCCWKLSLVERLHVLFTGKVWHQILTFYQPMQPQLLTISKPRNMTWNLTAATPPTLTPKPGESSPAASTTSDASAGSPTISDLVHLQNSGVSGSFSSALRGTNSSSPDSP